MSTEHRPINDVQRIQPDGSAGTKPLFRGEVRLHVSDDEADAFSYQGQVERIYVEYLIARFIILNKYALFVVEFFSRDMQTVLEWAEDKISQYKYEVVFRKKYNVRYK
jgi:hypothetical protein